jgi:hypothetical protein
MKGNNKKKLKTNSIQNIMWDEGKKQKQITYKILDNNK